MKFNIMWITCLIPIKVTTLWKSRKTCKKSPTWYVVYSIESKETQFVSNFCGHFKKPDLHSVLKLVNKNSLVCWSISANSGDYDWHFLIHSSLDIEAKTIVFVGEDCDDNQTIIRIICSLISVSVDLRGWGEAGEIGGVAPVNNGRRGHLERL